jgi:peptidoglycan/LPS O-acetylase OafA/YrhL
VPAGMTAKNQTLNLPKHFYSLDIIRGLAALSVVVWHWQHFFYGQVLQPNQLGAPVFNALLSFLYNHGNVAIHLFFTLSGFIFFCLYYDLIKDKKITAFHFFIKRFSRLYPLHLATLIFTAVAQYFYLKTHGVYFIYQLNDIYHFILNIFFIPYFGSDTDYSFNGPVWSVSIEVLLYLLFFIFAVLGIIGRRTLPLLIIAFIASGLWYSNYTIFGLDFFIGGLVFRCYSRIMASRYFTQWRIFIFFITVGAWLLIFNKAIVDIVAHIFYDYFNILFKKINGQYFLDYEFIIFYIAEILFPLTILATTLAEINTGHWLSKLRFIADISYSSFLLHFPLQLTFVLATDYIGVSRYFYFSSFSILFFFTILISLSLLSYHQFERPVQQAIRRIFIKPAYEI